MWYCLRPLSYKPWVFITFSTLFYIQFADTRTYKYAGLRNCQLSISCIVRRFYFKLLVGYIHGRVEVNVNQPYFSTIQKIREKERTHKHSRGNLITESLQDGGLFNVRLFYILKWNRRYLWHRHFCLYLYFFPSLSLENTHGVDCFPEYT